MPCHAYALTNLHIPILKHQVVDVASIIILDAANLYNVYLSEALSIKHVNIGMQKLETYVRTPALLIS